ncbi:ATP-binding protein (plasmid) [Microvirga terrae]|uniref:histidine kinase n=1 Tax=Microvirga terrae TaxID=2740529 RepID=A0ABY5RZ86_9HYPH|nr:ATP-binding protein [Microvirga terrae]UVF22575.1 ATP-binding protein [Microvirga terrae]
MHQTRTLFLLCSSLPCKLAFIAVLFLLAIIAVRSLSLDRLSYIHAVSGAVQSHWSGSIRTIGRVSQGITTARAEEAETLLQRDSPAVLTSISNLQRTLSTIASDIDLYRTIPHDSDEARTFDRFSKIWSDHVRSVKAIIALVQSGQRDEATTVFETDAKASFQAAEDALRSLVDLTETKSNAARIAAGEAMRRAQRFVSDLILSMLTMFIALTSYLWYSFSRPLFSLAQSMRLLASNDTGFSILFGGRRDEIGDVARSLEIFRRNTIELLESRKSLVNQANVLADSLERERALAAEQRNFIRTVSHELRTPLTSIDGNAQRLLATKAQANPSQIAERAHRIRAAVFQIISLVASFTGAMEMADGQMHPRVRPFDLQRMLRDLQGYYREIGMGDIREEGIGDIPGTVTGDPELLYYAFSNLVSNAFKYSRDSSIVKLEVKVVGACVEVTIEDQGLGIPPEEIDRVRERFFRGSNVGSRPGTGVGLYLVDIIIRQHGGSLRIESQIGKGTRMTVSLPIDCAGALTLEDASEQDLVYRGRRRDCEPPGGSTERTRLHG